MWINDRRSARPVSHSTEITIVAERYNRTNESNIRREELQKQIERKGNSSTEIKVPVNKSEGTSWHEEVTEG